MNIKALIAFVVLIAIGIFGYSYYSSKKHEERLAAIRAETGRVQAETARLEGYQPKAIIVNKAKNDEGIRLETVELASMPVASAQHATMAQEVKAEPVEKIMVEAPLSVVAEPATADKKSSKQSYYEASAKLKDLYARWSEAEKLAGSTPRIALAQQIGELQKIKAEARQLQLPNCQKYAKEHLVNAMQSSIDSFYSFSNQEANSAVQAKSDAAKKEYKQYEDTMKVCG